MRIALIGYGKMGKAIEEIAMQRGHEIVLRATHDTDLNSAALKNADVAIEFTNPHSAFDNITKCFNAGIPVVCGTTGWNDKMDEAKKICLQKNGAFFYASNFSVGVNIFFEVNKKLTQLLSSHPQYQVWVEETHHTKKKDAPSGTAITIANDIINSISGLHDWKNYNAGAEGEEYDDSDKSILNIISHRVDEVPGTHEVHYYSDEDDIKFIHTAHSRKGFATGAVLAAEFLFNKKGVFGMKDLLAL
jgi:4-hydroxy-tetrahydrodipicolinate reductase